MRRSILLFALLAPALSAQTAEDFYPLAEGNAWVYRIDDDGERVYRRFLVRQPVVQDGVAYLWREFCDYDLSSGAPVLLGCLMEPVRVTADGDVVVRSGGAERAEACGLGRADGASVPCDDLTGGGGATLTVERSGPATIRIGDAELAVADVQAFEPVGVSIDPPPARYAAGVGRLAVSPFAGYAERLEYARVGDAEYGVDPLDPDPASFDPLAVGTVREYLGSTGGGETVPMRQDDVRTIVLDGETWTLRRSQEREPVVEDMPMTRTETRSLVRYDAATANVLVRLSDGSEFPSYFCSLDQPVGQSECSASQTAILDLGVLVPVGDGERTTAVLRFPQLARSVALAAGLGVIAESTPATPEYRLRFADVGPLPTGDPLPVGTPLGDAFPTAIDPTPAHRYYPLSVGDEWHTEYGSFGQPMLYQRRRVVETVVVDTEVYAVEEVSRATPEAPAWVVEETRQVRFDAFSGHVVEPGGARLTDCPLDEPVNVDPDDVMLCNEAAGRAAFRVAGPLVQDVGPEIPTDAYKAFAYLGLADGVGTDFFVPGIGPVPNEDPFGGGGSSYAILRYARVTQPDGSTRTFGAPLPVAGDAAPAPSTLAVTASPTPTAGALRLRVTVPMAGALTVEAFDALGRRVHHEVREAAAGPLALNLDASRWAPGVYVVRVRAADGVATARVVRR